MGGVRSARMSNNTRIPSQKRIPARPEIAYFRNQRTACYVQPSLTMLCWGVLEIPLLEKVYWFLGFLVPKIIGFLFQRFLGFLVSNFQSFKDSMSPYYPLSISCVLEDLDLTSKSFKTVSDGSSGLFGAHRFEQCQKDEISNIGIFKQHIFRKWFRILSWIS